MMSPSDSNSIVRWPERWLWWCIAASCVAALVVAALIEPDARGYGTHTQLGLPPCGFLWLTGVPCPGCGLTTAFAHAVRGQWALAAEANPFGLILFLLACLVIPATVVAGLRRWSVDEVLGRFSIGRWALAVAASGVAVWVARLTTAL